MNIVMTAGLVVGVTGVVAVAACSEESSSGNLGGNCPAAGTKACENDEPVTQKAADDCKRCEAELSAYVECQGNATTPKCVDGKSEEQQPPDPTKCKTELEAIGRCRQGGTDGG